MDDDSTASGLVGESWLKEHKEESSKSLEGKEEVPDDAADDRGFLPIVRYSEESGFPDPREAPITNVRAALRRIIEEKVPITKALKKTPMRHNKEDLWKKNGGI